MCFSSKEPAPLEMAVPCYLGTETRHEGLLNRMELFSVPKPQKLEMALTQGPGLTPHREKT